MLPDIDTLATLGGELTNYAPIEDPTTDLDATADNTARGNVAMLTHTSRRAWCRFTAAASTGAMVRVAHDAMWGTSVPPTLARTGSGTFTVTWPTTVDDELGNSHSLNIRAASANSRGGSTLYFVSAVPTSANVITVYVHNAAGSLNDAVGVDFDVYAEL